jgi:hypothetical protein
MGTFQSAGNMMQSIIGGFASNLNKGDNDLSGNAVVQLLSAGNATAMPELVGYLQGLTQCANIMVDLIPKYLLNKRMIPIVSLNGDKEFRKINQEGTPYLDYEPGSIKVNITAGVNFQIQKNEALRQITALMQASPEFAAFMNDDETLPILVDNLTVYGSDRLKEAVPKWIEKKAKMQQEQQQQAQQAMMSNPQMLRAQAEMQKIQMQGQQNQIDNQLEIAKMSIEKELADAKILESEAKVSQAQIDSSVRLEEAQTSIETHALDSAAKLAEIQSREHDNSIKHHANHRENIKLAHELHKANEDNGEENEQA